MKLIWLGGIALFIVLLLNALTPVSVQAQGNEFEAGYLRTDQSGVYNSIDYRMDIKAGVIPANFGATPLDFTTGWLGVNVTQNQGEGCLGAVNDIVGLNQWHRVELVKYTALDYWIARVYNATNTQSWDVARLHIDVDRIYKAYPTFEHGFNGVNVHLDGQYWFRLPQYNNGGWQNWPYSGPNSNQHNYIQAKARNWAGFIAQTHCDTYYGVTVPLSAYMWEWYVGDSGADCGYILPPITYDNFNGSLSYTGSWTHSPSCCPFAWKEGLSWTNVTNDKVSLTASPANSITRVYTLAPNRGSSRVKINGSTVALANENTATKRWQVARTWSASGSTTIEVSNYCCGYVDADAFLIDTPRVGATTYDDIHYMLRYIGDWTHAPACCGTGTDPYDDTLSWSNQSESAVTFTFTGDEVRYVYTKVNPVNHRAASPACGTALL